MTQQFEISETEDHGAIVSLSDAELADQFEDFLTEKCYVLFNVKFEPGCAVFYFGQAASPDKLRALVRRFLEE